VTGFVAQIGLRPDFPLRQTDLSYGLCDGYAKRSEAVEDRGPDLDLRNLPVKVSRREALTEQFHTMHPPPGNGLPANHERVVSTRLRRWYWVSCRHNARPKYLEDRTASFRALAPGVSTARQCMPACTKGGLPKFSVLARRDNGMGIPSCNCVVAFARIVGTIAGDAADLLVRRDLIEKIGKYGRISDAAARDLDRSYLECFLIDPPLSECTIRLPGNGCGSCARGGVSGRHACVRSTRLRPQL